MDASEVERRRDYKRRELIKRELVSAGLTWGMGVGLGAFVVLGLILFVVMNQMKMTSNTNALIGGAAAVLFISAGAGRYALREARRRIVSVLSKMPYDELLRRCAR
jgi:protein-S-isoprenylcysteine O-methyltransferase Ste14